MKLHEYERAPNPRRVRIFLAEKGIEVPRVQVDIATREHKGEAYRKLAPNGRVPCLELDDGSTLLESVAICRYFEEQNPNPPLFGTGAEERAQVEMWQRRMELELFFPLAYVFRHTHPGMAQAEDQVPEFGEKQKKVVAYGLRTLDKQLQAHPWVAGENYSIADITAQCALDFFLPLTRTEVPAEYEALLAWREKVAARPSASA